jgi:hypothetical protein
VPERAQLTFDETVELQPMKRNRELDREEIRQRVANFKAHQQRLIRERQDYARSTLMRMKASLDAVADPRYRTHPPPKPTQFNHHRLIVAGGCTQWHHGPGIHAGVFVCGCQTRTTPDRIMPSARAALNEHRSSPSTTIRGKTLSALPPRPNVTCSKPCCYLRRPL